MAVIKFSAFAAQGFPTGFAVYNGFHAGVVIAVQVNQSFLFLFAAIAGEFAPSASMLISRRIQSTRYLPLGQLMNR